MPKIDLNFKNYTIAKKLLVGFGFIFTFILLNTILTVVIHVHSQLIEDKETEEYAPVQQDLNEMLSLIIESGRLTVNWVYVDHQTDTPDKLRLAQIIDGEFAEKYEGVLLRTEEWEDSFTDTLRLVNERVQDYFDMQRTVMNNLNSFEAYDDVMMMMESEMLVQSDGDMQYLGDDLNELMDRLIETCDNKCHDIREDINFFSNLQLWFIIFFSLFVMGISILVGIVLNNGIVKPITRGLQFAEAVGNGDLSVEMETSTSGDEIGKLTNALNKMLVNLRRIVLSIEKNANDLVDSSELLKASSNKLSRGASDQATSAEEVSTAVEEMVANIDQNTENAITTEKITTSTVENVTLSSQYSAEAAEAMNLISKKISIISDIAFQTNILALNAAVEAVRAGEHGRGFSVVAAEVRKLAEHSKDAANEIVALVAKGMKVSQAAGEKAKSLVPEIEKTTVLIKEIAAASIEQKTGAEQINLAMQNLNVITQENASSSDELTGSAVALGNLARGLKESVSFFKLSDDPNRKESMIHNKGTKIDLNLGEDEISKMDASKPIKVDLNEKKKVVKPKKVVVKDETVESFGAKTDDTPSVGAGKVILPKDFSDDIDDYEKY